MFFRSCFIIILLAFLSCYFVDDNPLDESGSNYIPPTIVIDSFSVRDGDTIKGSTAFLVLSGNTPENEFRVRVKNREWSPWFEAGFYVLDSLTGGTQVIELCGRYAGGDYFTYDSMSIFVIEQIIDTLTSESDIITIIDTISISDSMKIAYTVNVTDIVLVMGELGLPDSGFGMNGIGMEGLYDTVRIIDTIIDTIRIIDTIKVTDTTETDTIETDTTETDTTETDTIEIDTTETDTTEIDTTEIDTTETDTTEIAGDLYSITYNAKESDGGIIPIDTNKYSTGTVVIIIAGEPLYILHDFVGWKYSNSEGKKIYKERDTLIMGTSDIILEAQWESSPSFLIELDGNGCTSQEFPFPIYKLEGELFYVPIISPVWKEGHILTSWNTDKNGEGTSYNPGDKIRIEKNIILYAQWEKIKGTLLRYVCEDCDKEKIFDIVINVPEKVVIIDSSVFTRTGYSFEEWNTSKDGSGKGYKIGDTIIIKDKDINLYAQWNSSFGMILIPSKDKVFKMGGSRSEIEWPIQDVKFSKNIWFDSVEVTQLSFYEVMKEFYPDLAEDFYSEMEKNKPVSNVNWYGAVLYCNARTRLTNSTDTVFIYTERINKSFTEYELCNLEIDMDKKGFRLPTEAEWEYAARGDVIKEDLNEDELSDIGWYKNNSGNKIKSVATIRSNAFNLYDMLGNVSEWTIDWYYPYVESNVHVDPVNLRIFDNINTGRIHRGGNVTQGSNKTSCSYREYSLPSTCSKYIGFRCCLPIN